jgi:hypothetical protein
MDMIVSVLSGPLKYLHNVGAAGNHWISLKLVGTKSNRMGLGAQVHVITADGQNQWNEATTAVGYASSSDPRVHFGLGSNRKISENRNSLAERDQASAEGRGNGPGTVGERAAEVSSTMRYRRKMASSFKDAIATS